MLLKKIEDYWTNRAQGYCEVNLKELNCYKRHAWTELIAEYCPKVDDRRLEVLDIGTGPGFFAIIMAEMGHHVTAVDYTSEMIEKAKNNAGKLNDRISFYKMDAHDIKFDDNTFDLIITRNLTWNLEDPEKAYASWYRVLKKGGVMLNFDANWYLHVHYEDKREEYEQDRLRSQIHMVEDHYVNTDTSAMEEIARNLPLSRIERPQWDSVKLLETGFNKVFVESGIGDKVWDDEEKINYRSTPMFLIGGIK
ncbi:class I SAM-dependent methyltransferase [Alkalibacter mobilis]|uniref:class I SAM-dependent methyltransferase n=1 Tax=Alkalibacter mobilis TaxID=2787712 RepID=UPI00189F45FF|nr:class I SAM-dependent methyltransferase [Alkalibacter mobilis]MBF7097689.1 class I SAM-dependent methyltransferase [Alkalibacter mobilis]